MTLALIHSRALLGLQAPAVTVEVHLANGLPSFTLVGLADTEVKEARERVRCAIQNAGLDFPSNQRITVNLAPADLPKDSGRFDLPIALGILAANGQLDETALALHEFAGELSLSGALRPVRGALAMGLAVRGSGARTRLVLPPGSAEEAALVPTAEVYRAQHLSDVVAHFAKAQAQTTEGWCRIQPPALNCPTLRQNLDLTDVKGQAGPRRALEIAAAGGHSLLLVGPPGTGKSMLAHRFAALLPDMTLDDALESAAIASLDKAVAAQTRPQLVAALKALDRVLRHGHYSVPHWYGSVHRVAWRSGRFERPAVTPRYYQPETWASSTWWATIDNRATLAATKRAERAP